MPFSGLIRKFGIRPLAARLLAYVLLFSVILSLAATALQLLGESERRLADLRNLQEKTAEMISGNLSTQLWLMDHRGVTDTLDDLLAFGDIQHARVTTTQGEEFSAGEYPEGEVITRDYPLRARGDGIAGAPEVGRLTLTSSADRVWQELWERALLLLGFQSLIVMLGTLGLLLIVRQMLSRHLETMASYATRLNLNALIDPLRLNRKPPRHPDELSEIEQALNTMRVRLLEETRDLRQNSVRSQGERDEAIRANHAKNLFLANVSHELRIPLQSVLGYASLLEDTGLDQEQRDYVRTLLNAAEGLSSIINDLLDISSMEAGKLVLDRQPFDLRDTLDDVISMLGDRARQKHLALEQRVDDNLPDNLLGDPMRLRQVLLNLTANAIRYTDSGHVLVSAEVLGRKEDQVHLRLAVEDTGVGIRDEDLPLIYEPYVQLGQRSRHQPTGAGLGLTISRQLVGLMAGRLDVSSHPGQGSTFWVELTLPVAPKTAPRVRPDMRSLQGRRILVVDSYELSRKITLEMLARLDVDIEAAGSAGEALLTLRNASENDQVFDAVVMDGFVPDMDGDLLCRQIRDNPDWERTRLLILSANPQRGDAEHFRKAGADAFLSKSLRESCLGPILHQLFADSARGERHFLTRFSLQGAVPSLGDPLPLPCGPMSVLLVEDNPVNLALTQRLLEKLGCRVTTARDGRVAVELLKRRRFDLIFMDCVMPEMDGFEATRALREWERAQQLPHTPVIALTASAMETDEEHSRRVGMDLFVAKPVNVETLRAVLEQFCRTSVDQPLPQGS